MNILYAIQGTGNGHLSRANSLIPHLCKKGNVDVLVSGKGHQFNLDHPIKYSVNGLGFYFGQKGGIDWLKSLKNVKLLRFLIDLNRIPWHHYDLIISDFEPLSALAAKLFKAPVVGMSHQYAVMAKDSPKARKYDKVSQWILKHYAACEKNIGFHFEAYQEDIFLPIIRPEIRQAKVSEGKHITVYLPAYGMEQLHQMFGRFPQVQWEIFSKDCSHSFQQNNCWFHPVEKNHFTQSLIDCQGLVAGAGFESPAEALHLGKKLLVIPMRGQYEQSCNAAALEAMGVKVLPQLSEDHLYGLGLWLQNGKTIHRHYPEQSETIVEHLLGEFLPLESVLFI